MDMNLGHTRRIIDAGRAAGVLRNQLAYLLATARWETNHTMEPVREAYWLSEDWRKSNLRYYPFYGRGFVQLTWADNYRRAGDIIGVDLVSDPDKALDVEIAAEVLVRGCMAGWFTGKKIGDYITLHRSDFVGARRVVNGTDKAEEIAALARDYDAALKAEGYGVQTAPDPAEQPQGILAALVAAILSIFGKGKA